MKKRVAILGSTGSIGTQALEVIRQHRDLFEVEVLTAGRNADLLIEQALQFVPSYVVIADETQYSEVREALSRLPVQVLTGMQALAGSGYPARGGYCTDCHGGFSGLHPHGSSPEGRKGYCPGQQGNPGGGRVADHHTGTGTRCRHITRLIRNIRPSFSAWPGKQPESVEKLILTASGGPFRGMSRDRAGTGNQQGSPQTSQLVHGKQGHH